MGNVKIWEILTGLWFFTKIIFLKIMPIRIFSSKLKLGSWNSVQWYLYVIPKNLWSNILNFRYVSEIQLITSKILNILSVLPEIFDLFPKEISNSKPVPQIFRYSIEEQIMRKKSLLTWFWENEVFVKNSQSLTDFINISQIFAFLPIKPLNYLKSQ